MENSGETQRIVSKVMEEYDVIEEPMAEGQSSEEIEDGGVAGTEQQQVQAVDVKGDNSGSGSGTSDSSQQAGDVQRKPLGSARGSQRLSVGRDEDTTQFELLCPRVNCPEKIVICLDFSSEMDKPMFRTRAGDKFAPLKLVKRALGFYIHSKHSMDTRHEFALMLLQDSAIWVRDFTNDPREVVNLLDDLEDTAACETCDLSSLFQSIYDRTPMPSVDGDPMVLPPPYIVRVLIIYGRSHCPISVPHKEAQRALFSSPYFFVDAFYVHETPSEDNLCEDIFDSLCDLDHKGFSYIFEASRNPTKIYDFMAQLLAHPLQRPGQKDTSYKLKPRLTGE